MVREPARHWRLIISLGPGLLVLAALITVGFAVTQQTTVVTLRAENPYDGMIVPIELPFKYSVLNVDSPKGVEVSYLEGLISADAYHPIVLVDVPEGLGSLQIAIEVNKR